MWIIYLKNVHENVYAKYINDKSIEKWIKINSKKRTSIGYKSMCISKLINAINIPKTNKK